MDGAGLRAVQEPLKDSYRSSPHEALVTLRAGNDARNVRRQQRPGYTTIRLLHGTANNTARSIPPILCEHMCGRSAFGDAHISRIGVSNLLHDPERCRRVH
jgi:hypothetical protein